MAHLQPTQIHHNDSQLHSTMQETQLRASSAPSGLSAQSQPARQAHEAVSRERSKEPEPGLLISGFPWQFVLVMAVIALGVIALVGKAMGIF
jgi:hypothetical protein